MKVKYSPSTGGFYIREIHGDAIPGDAVEISPEAYAALLEGQSKGKRIGHDTNGSPVLLDPLEPTSGALWQAFQRTAQLALDSSDITVLRCVENGIAVPAEWVAYREALREILRAGAGDPNQGLPTIPAYPPGT